MALVADILEAVMVIAFGASWPFNLAKSIKTKSTKGKSLLFLLLIDFGYVAGIISKIVNPHFVWASKWWIFFFYVLNFVLVSADLIMYFINRHNERKAK